MKYNWGHAYSLSKDQQSTRAIISHARGRKILFPGVEPHAIARAMT
jgi:hypothetical protein